MCTKYFEHIRPSFIFPFILMPPAGPFCHLFFLGLDYTYKRKHEVLVFLSLFFWLNMMISSSINFPEINTSSFFLWLNNITLYVYITFFIHSTID
jgi:hypothetical protein